SNENISSNYRDIMDMIQNSSDGPVARLKKRFRKGMIIIPMIAAFTLNMLLKKPDFMHIVIASYIGAFCIIMMIYFFIGYRQMSAMQIINDDVKSALLRQVGVLQNGLLWR